MVGPKVKWQSVRFPACGSSGFLKNKKIFAKGKYDKILKLKVLSKI